MTEYIRFSSEKLKEVYNSLSNKDKKYLETFLSECSTSANPNKVADIKRCILQFFYFVKKETKDMNQEDLVKFLNILNSSNREENTKHDLKAHIKRFLKWRFEDWNKRFKEFKVMRSNKAIGINQKKINPETLLTKKEIETIMKKENDFMLKTFFITLYESGMRPSELRKLKFEQIKLNSDGDLSEINVFMNKNQQHKVVYVKEATFYLKKLLEASSCEYVFPSIKEKGSPIADNTATRWINSLGKHINKKIYPYLLRHTRSQEIYDLVDEGKLSENVATKFLGHSKSMRHIYQSLSTKTLKEAMTKAVYTFEEIAPEKKHELRQEMDKIKQVLNLLLVSDKAKLIHPETLKRLGFDISKMPKESKPTKEDIEEAMKELGAKS